MPVPIWVDQRRIISGGAGRTFVRCASLPDLRVSNPESWKRSQEASSRSI